MTERRNAADRVTREPTRGTRIGKCEFLSEMFGHTLSVHAIASGRRYGWPLAAPDNLPNPRRTGDGGFLCVTRYLRHLTHCDVEPERVLPLSLTEG
jgi:hypothetical protein